MICERGCLFVVCQMICGPNKQWVCDIDYVWCWMWFYYHTLGLLWYMLIYDEAWKTGEFIGRQWLDLVMMNLFRKHNKRWIMICVINSLAPGRSECDSENVIFNLVLLIGIFRSSLDNALWWMPQYLTDDESTLVQVMAWCHQATSHYLSQCWPRSLSPYGVTRP